MCFSTLILKLCTIVCFLPVCVLLTKFSSFAHNFLKDFGRTLCFCTPIFKLMRSSVNICHEERGLWGVCVCVRVPILLLLLQRIEDHDQLLLLPQKLQLGVAGLNLRAPPGKSAPAADEAPGHATAATAALPTTSGLAAAAPTASAGTGKVVQEAAAAAATTSGKLDFAATTASATSTVTSSTSVAPVARVWNSATSLVTVATAPAQQGAVEVSEKAWTAAPASEEYKRSSSGPGLGWDSELVAASSDQAAAGSSSYRSVLGEARAKLAMVEKRALEELRTKVAAAEAKAAMNQEKGEEKATQLEQELKKLEDELRDSAAIEVALFSIVAEHVRSPHKLHTPARRLARLYVHTFRNRSSDRCINSAKNYAAGLIVAIRACGNDVSRFVDIVPRSCCTHQLEYKPN